MFILSTICCLTRFLNDLAKLCYNFQALIAQRHRLLVIRAHTLGQSHVHVRLGNAYLSLDLLGLFFKLVGGEQHLYGVLVVAHRLRVRVLKEAKFA